MIAGIVWHRKSACLTIAQNASVPLVHRGRGVFRVGGFIELNRNDVSVDESNLHSIKNSTSAAWKYAIA